MAGEQIITISKWLLGIVGLWTLNSKQHNMQAKMYRIYSVITMSSYCSYMISLLSQFVILIRENNNPERIIQSLAILIIISENATKYVIFKINQIGSMFADIIKNERDILISDDAEIKTLYQKQVKFCRLINIFQVIAIIFATGNFASLSFVEFNKNGIIAFENKAFMHDVWYPFVKENHITAMIIIQMYYLIIGGSINVATLTSFVVLIIFSSTKLRILQIRIKQIGQNQQDIVQNKLEEDVKNLIKEHQYIIRNVRSPFLPLYIFGMLYCLKIMGCPCMPSDKIFVTFLNERTKYVMLMDFILNSLNLASALVQVLTATKFGESLYAVALLFLVVMHVFAITWVANDLKLQSMGVADAVYESNWYEQTKQVKTLLSIMLTRAQKPLLLTIGPFGPMTNETALSIVKAAYTYLTILMKSYK